MINLKHDCMTKNLKRGISALARALGVIVLSFSSSDSKAQFLYTGMGAHLSANDPYGPQMRSLNIYASAEAAPFVAYRFGRHLGLGISARVPLFNTIRARNSTYYTYGDRITGEYANGEEFYNWSSEDYSNDRVPESMTLKLNPAVQYAAHLMLFLDADKGFFLEARAVFGGYREEFQIFRIGSTSARPLNETVRARNGGVYPGIGLGILRHIDEQFFLRFHTGLDLVLPSKDSGFRYTMESQPSGGQLQTLTLRSTLEWGVVFQAGVTFGFRF